MRARHNDRPNRVRQPADRLFTSSCSPPFLSKTQLPSVNTCRSTYAGTFTLPIKRLRRRTYADPLGLKTQAAFESGYQSQVVPHRFVVSYCRFLAVGCGLNEIHCLSSFLGLCISVRQRLSAVRFLSAFMSVYQRFFFCRCISGWLAPDTTMKKGPKNEFFEPPHTLLKLLAA